MIFKRFGINVPAGRVVDTHQDARKVAEELGKPVVLKAQVLVGGRGKAGGIKTAYSPAEAEEEAARLLGSEISGFKVNKLLVEEKIDFDEEIYLSVAIDDTQGCPIVMVSPAGGVDIEEVAMKSPEKIFAKHVDILRGFREFEARRLVKQIGLKGGLLLETSSILLKLYSIFRAYNAEIVEINPLFVTRDKKVVAGDARLNIDDHALFRHPEFEALRLERFEDPLEGEAQRRGLNFVNLRGNVAVMGNGAGLTMSLLDSIKMFGGKPACFLDTGGGLTVERAENALKILLKKAMLDEEVKAIFFAFWFMISPAKEVIEGFKRALEEIKPRIPVIGVVQGVGAEEMIGFLKEIGIRCYPSIEEGVRAAVEVSKV